MRTTWLWLALIFAVQSQAQIITGCEYFFDTDPGMGNGSSLSITSGDSLLLNTTVPTNALTQGFHKLYVRVLDANGAWSLYEGRTVYIQGAGNTNSSQLTAAEYFYDTDPGLGNGIALPTSSADSLMITTNIPTTSLSPGFHKLYVRAKNAEGQWSLYEGRTIYIQDVVSGVEPQLTEAEYFYDTDPGLGNGTDLGVSTGDSISFSTTVPTVALANGFHKLFVRAKNTNNKWSLYEGRTFYIHTPNSPDLEELVAAEFFYDIDPGMGGATSFSVSPGDSLMINSTNDISALAPGFHNFFVRAQNNFGKWSLYEGRTFFIQDEPDPDTLTIVAAEYYFDLEPGFGLATPLDIIPGDSIDASFTIPQDLPIGVHTMYIRCMSSNGDWSLFESRDFEDIDTDVLENSMQQTVLYQNYPNPFVSSTQFEFFLRDAQEVTIQITDLSGKLIKVIPLRKLNSGKHLVALDTGELSEGYYFYKMVTPDFTDTKQMLITR